VSKNGTTDHGAGGGSGRIDGTSKLRTAGRLRPPSLSDPVVLFWTASYVVFFVIALATPETILDDYPQARRFTDLMAAIVPQIDLVARASGPAAQANRFVYSLLWAAIPIYTFVLVRQMRRHVLSQGFASQPRSWVEFAVVIAFAIYVFVDGLFFMWEADPNSRMTRRLFIAPVGRAFWAPLWAFAPVLFFVFGSFWVWGAVTGRFRPRAKP
jgi:hypothetical protein